MRYTSKWISLSLEKYLLKLGVDHGSPAGFRLREVEALERIATALEMKE